MPQVQIRRRANCHPEGSGSDPRDLCVNGGYSSPRSLVGKPPRDDSRRFSSSNATRLLLTAPIFILLLDALACAGFGRCCRPTGPADHSAEAWMPGSHALG